MDAFDSQHADERATLLALHALGSFAAAGRALQRHPSVLSRRLSALEARLGVRLVERSTRQLRFTDAGLRLVERLQQARQLLDEAEQEARQTAQQVRGRLRLALPAAMGRRLLSPMIAAFALAHPEVVLEVEYGERFVDLVGERFDAALRIGELADSRLVAIKLHDHARWLGASPAYLARHGTPAEPQDLRQHNCLGFTGLASFPQWRLEPVGQGAPMRVVPMQVVPVRGSLTSNDNEALLNAALAGVGILAAGDWLLGPDLAAGRLQRVLPGWQLRGDGGIYLVRPSAQYTSAALAAFRAWVQHWFQTQPPWCAAAASTTVSPTDLP
mgnify:CR=1 FL=1